MIEQDKMGGRRIYLHLPFKHGKRMIRAVTLAPVVWNHTLRWQNGEYVRSMDLFHELADLPEEVLRQIRYPDIDVVLLQFMDMLPPQIRDDIASGHIPQRVSLEETQEKRDVMSEALPDDATVAAPLSFPPPPMPQQDEREEEFAGDGLGFELT